jgi:prepilin-type N-terminal cleavage/methylation domain-containing protein
MKLQIPFPGSSRHRSQTLSKGFTLPEILIAMTIFLIVVGAVVSANLFGLKMFYMTNTKLIVTQWSRQTIGKITGEVRACNSVQVGNYTTNGSFVGFLVGETNQGNSLLIYPTADTNNYIMYFVNLADQTFRRTDQSSNSLVLADSVTNTLPFSAQDFSGTVLTNNNNNSVIHLILEFYQPASFMQDANYYKLETSVKQRVVPPGA